MAKNALWVVWFPLVELGALHFPFLLYCTTLTTPNSSVPSAGKGRYYTSYTEDSKKQLLSFHVCITAVIATRLSESSYKVLYFVDSFVSCNVLVVTIQLVARTLLTPFGMKYQCE